MKSGARQAKSKKNAKSAPVKASAGHSVQFYEKDAGLLDGIGRYIGAALGGGGAAIVVATGEHRVGIAERLESAGFDLRAVTKSGRYAAVDARETLNGFMTGDVPDEEKFQRVIGCLIEQARSKAAAGHGQVAIFGEIVALLCAAGRPEAALQIEHFWNALAQKYSFTLRCGYPLAQFERESDQKAFREICKAHALVIPAEGRTALENEAEQQREIADSQRQMTALGNLVTARRSGQMFGRFIDEVQDYAIFMLDREGRITTWNAGAQRIKGWTANEILGKHFSIFYLKEDKEARKPQRLLEIASAEGRVESEGWRVRKDGTTFWASVVITAVHNDDGSLAGFLKVTRDLTEWRDSEQKLRDSNHALELLASSLQEQASLLQLWQDAIVVRNPDSSVRFWNNSAQKMYGWSKDEALGKVTHDLFQTIFPISKEEVDRSLFGGAGAWEGELIHTTRDGRRIVVNSRQILQRDAAGKPVEILEINREITDRKQIEEALVQSEESLRLLLDGVQDCAIIRLDPSGLVTSWNSGAERIKGYHSEEIIGRHFSVFYPEEDRRGGRPEEQLETAIREGRVEEEAWRVRKDGSKFWANAVLTALKDESGQVVGFAKMTRDFTERRESQERLREVNRELNAEIEERIEAERKLRDSEASLRNLSTHVLRLQDEERRRVGRELHDSVGQWLVALKMSLDGVRLSNKLEEKVQKQLLDCSNLADDAIKETRTLSYVLYPPMLEEAGLASAMQWFVEGFTKRSGIRTTLDAPMDLVRLGQDRELALFRVLQEGLTNVHRHSGSETAQVRVGRVNGFVTMEVQDFGKGMPPKMLEFSREELGTLGVGLRGMNERLRQLGGVLEVTSGPQGTILTAKMPIEAEKGREAASR